MKNGFIEVFMAIGWGSANIDNGLKLCSLSKEISFESSKKEKKGGEYLCFLTYCRYFQGTWPTIIPSFIAL